MKPGPKPTYDREQVRRLHLDGKSGREIAAIVGCRPDHVSYILLVLGLRQKGVKPEQKPVDVAKVAALSADGKSQRHIARACGCHPEKVREVLRGLGILRPHAEIEALEAADETPCGAQIGEWPADIHFTDAKVSRSIGFRTPRSSPTESLIGCPTEMCSA